MSATTSSAVPATAVSAATHAADRLLLAVQRAGAPLCVGLDPVAEKLPESLRANWTTRGPELLAEFCGEIIRSVADVAACVKVQSACFERYGAAGFAALEQTIAAARTAGVQVILDAKRGDIGISAEHYAAAAFDHLRADWLTVSGYLGRDAIEPFVRPGCGVMVLVRTSNPGSDEVQSAPLASGGTVSQAMAGLVRSMGDASKGSSGYSAIGAVVGGTKGIEIDALRQAMPNTLFLVPGYGPQGAGMDDILRCFNRDGRGAILTASRAVNYAFAPDDRQWPEAVRAAAIRIRDELRTALSSLRGHA